MSEKKYCGKGKAVKTQYGELLTVNIKVSELDVNEKGYANISVGMMKQADPYGNTHTVWNKQTKAAPVPETRAAEISETAQDFNNSQATDDLPF